MKKISIALLTAAILLCLGSCGNDEKKETSVSTTEPPATLEEMLRPENDDLNWGDFEVLE
ncbi:MAG: hypothetical protein IJ416_11010 [Ruminiclostridium sp.]|nr:hypothetical protein [Ruminiclostridium sp.]